MEKQTLNTIDDDDDDDDNEIKTTSTAKTTKTMQAKTTATTTTTMMMMMMMKRPIKWSDFSLSADTLVKISKKIQIQIDDDKKCQNEYCTSNEQSQQQQQRQEYQDETTWLKKFLMKMKNIGCQSLSVSFVEILLLDIFFYCDDG